MPETSVAPVLEVRHLSRRFPGVALDEVNFEVRRGEVHALVGENGAGTSTLINILAGVLQPSAGLILLDGNPGTEDSSDVMVASCELQVASYVSICRAPATCNL
jgi:ribose transport system ATP-binding protein